MLSTQRLQRAAEDAGGAAAACEVHLRHHRDPQGAGHGAVALPALRPAPGRCRDAGRRISPASPSAEGVAIEPEALALIARAAEGSVRDGLSLLDQAIAQAAGAVTAERGARHAGPGRPRPVLDLLTRDAQGDAAGGLETLDAAATSAAPTRSWCCRTCWSSPTGSPASSSRPTRRDAPSCPRRNAPAARRLAGGSRCRCWRAPGRCC